MQAQIGCCFVSSTQTKDYKRKEEGNTEARERGKHPLSEHAEVGSPHPDIGRAANLGSGEQVFFFFFLLFTKEEGTCNQDMS